MNYFDFSVSGVIGGRIRSERLNRHMTQAEFAALLGISTSYLGALERGIRPVSRSIMDRLHERFHVSYDYLLDGTKNRDTAIRNTVAEPEHYRLRRSFHYLLNSCSNEEMRQCYRLLYSYLNCLRSAAPEDGPEDAPKTADTP